MRRFVLTATVMAAVTLAAGCEGASYAITRHLDSGRQVVISSTNLPRRMSFDSTVDSTTARIGPRKVTVEPTRIEVDGDRVATIGESTKSATVFEQWDKLRIVADDVTVYAGAF